MGTLDVPTSDMMIFCKDVAVICFEICRTSTIHTARKFEWGLNYVLTYNAITIKILVVPG